MESVNVVARTERMPEQERHIPAVLYGKSMGSQSIYVLAGQQRVKKWHAGSKFTLDFDGKTFNGTLEEVQTDPVGTEVKHLSFHVVSTEETTKVDVPVVTTHTKDVAKGGIVTIMLGHVLLKGKLSALPEELVIDVSGMQLNDTITLADLKLPNGVEFAYGRETNLQDKVVVVCKPSNAGMSGASEASETPAEETETNKPVAH